MAEVAAAAGVSKMSVSLALRGSSRISEATRNHILEVADRLNYRPNPMVQTLMANLRATRPVELHSTIAWVTSFETKDGWSDHLVSRHYFEGAVNRGRELGYRIEPIWAFSKGMTGERLSNILKARGIRGVIIPPVLETANQMDLEWEHFSLATLGFSFTEQKLHRAAAHLRDGMRQSLEQCELLGYQRVGFVTLAYTEERVGRAWLATYLAWQQVTEGAMKLPVLYVSSDTDIEDVLGDWLEENRPDVIISANAEIFDWLPRLFKIQVPQDIGFVALAKSEQYAYNDQLTGINQLDSVMGASAVDLVVEQLHRNEVGLPKNPKVVLTEGAWEAGASVCEAKPRAKPKVGRPTSVS